MMDQAVIKYYRGLLRNGFLHAGSIENPSIFLDSVGENLPICGRLGKDYVHFFIQMREQVVVEAKYLCTCDPTANVVFEILFGLIQGKTTKEINEIQPEIFSEISGSQDPDFIKRVKGSLELLNRGIIKYLASQPA